jgi:hypothetical protein
MGITGPLDYTGLLAKSRSASGWPIEAVEDAAMAAYARHAGAPEIVEFAQGPANYLFDAGGHAAPGGEDRTVLAWAATAHPPGPRDAAYQRGYPIPAACAGRALDRGHFIPHSGGGQFGPNLFPQDRALNRGWSAEGRDFRRLEARAAAQPGTLYFIRPRYVDASYFPALLDVGLLDRSGLAVATFRNRYDRPALPPAGTPGQDALSVALGGASAQELGDLGEETCAAWLEGALDAVIVSLGGAGMPRPERRQDLDVVAICGDELIAFEVKARHRSRLAGRLTRAGNLRAPRLRRPTAGTSPRQGSQRYVADRLADIIDTSPANFDGIESRAVAVDFDACLIQQFQMDDAGRRLSPVGSPQKCRDYALQALARIGDHRAAATSADGGAPEPPDPAP